MTPQEYCARNPHLSHASKQKLRYSESRWLRLTGVPLDQVRPEHFVQLRTAGLAAGLSPHSIEQTCQDVSLLTGVHRGKPLDRPLPSPDVPTVQQVDAIYRHVSVAQWPVSRSWMSCSTKDWWQGWIVVAGFCGLRLRDLRAMTMDCVRARKLTASKTKKTHPLPISGFLHRHIQSLNATDKLFGTLPEKQLRRELQRIATAAGVPYVPPHGFRRFAVTQWSLANDLAGRIIHGEGLSRVMAHYVQPQAILDKWAPQVEVPASWLTPKERADAIRAETELLAHYRRASQDTRDALLRIARAV